MSYLLLISYVGGLAVVYSLFVKLRSKKRGELKAPWFPVQKSREAYLAAYDAAPDEMGAEDVKQLKNLLMRRAVDGISRIFSLREDRPALAQLLSRGVISDSLWTEFVSAEQDVEREIGDCVRCANELQEDWGKQILSQAVQIFQRERERKAEENSKRAAAASAQDTPAMRRARDELLREIEREEKKEKKNAMANNQRGGGTNNVRRRR